MLIMLTTGSNGPPPRKEIDRLRDGLDRARRIRGTNEDAGKRLLEELEHFRSRLGRKRLRAGGELVEVQEETDGRIH